MDEMDDKLQELIDNSSKKVETEPECETCPPKPPPTPPPPTPPTPKVYYPNVHPERQLQVSIGNRDNKAMKVDYDKYLNEFDLDKFIREIDELIG